MGYAVEHDPQPAAPTSSSPAAPRPPSTRCRSPAFAAMQALSTRNDDPEHASRPYDTGRDGFVLGEGAARHRARDRGARPGPRRADLRRARRRSACPPTRTTSPPPSPRAPAPPAPCSRRSSGPALAPKDIVHINAHATLDARSATSPSTTRSSARSATAVDDIAGLRHQVDDRAPARRRRRARGASSRSWRSTTGSRRRRSTSTTQDPAIPLDVVTGEPRKLPAGRHRRAEQLVRLRRPQRRPGHPQHLSLGSGCLRCGGDQLLQRGTSHLFGGVRPSTLGLHLGTAGVGQASAGSRLDDRANLRHVEVERSQAGQDPGRTVVDPRSWILRGADVHHEVETCGGRVGREV